MKRAVNIVVAGAILLALLGYMVTYTVRFNEAAIVTTFGNAGESSVINGPGEQDAGLHFKWPWPISQVARKYDTRLQVSENILEQQQLADNQTITLNTYIAWRISDPLKFYKRVGSRGAALEALNLRMQDARSAVGQYTFDQLTNSDPNQLMLDELEQELKRRIELELAQLDNGITVEDVGVKRLMLPAGVSEIVVARMRSERTRMAEEYRAVGQERSQTLRQEAESQRQLIESFAQSAATEIEAEGRRRAGEILARFAANEDFAIYLLQLQALEETLSRRTTFIIDTSMPPFNLLRGIPQPETQTQPPESSADADGGN